MSPAPKPNAANTFRWTLPLGSALPVATRGKRPTRDPWTSPLPRVTVQMKAARS